MRIVVHGDPQGDRVVFENRLHAKCQELKADLVVVDGDRPDQRSDSDAVAVSVVFPAQGGAWAAAQAADHQALQDATHPVLSVVTDSNEAAGLPKTLKKYNAFQKKIWGAHWVDGLVDEVLSHGWQRRHERRVFISYRRIDSGPVANQLHDELLRMGYVVFLDDVSIDKGVSFQHSLKWWLNDADVLLLLFTPGYVNSEWCMAEVNFARASSIGLLVVEWPKDVAFPVAAVSPGAVGAAGGAAPAPVIDSVDIDQRLQLEQKDFDGLTHHPINECTLSTDGLLNVVAHCARQRAQAIRQRLDELVPLAELELMRGSPSATFRPVPGSPGDFVLTQGGQTGFVRILPFRPDARHVHDVFQNAQLSGYATIGCFYNEYDRKDPRAQAMRWLVDGERVVGSSKTQLQLWACVGDKVNP